MIKIQKSKGFILITSYLMVSVLELFSMAIFARNNVFLQATEHNGNKIAAFNMAEAGLDATIPQLKQNTNYAGTNGYVAVGNNTGYNVSVCPPTCTGVTAPILSTVRRVQTTGYAPGNNNTSRAYETRTVVSYVRLDDTPFDYGAFGDSSLTLNGTPLVDSYDSRNGSYGGSNVGNNGDIASDGNISLIGNPVVKGKVVNNPEISCSPASPDASLSSSGALTISGSNNYVLPAGTYRYSSISISGSGTLTTTGPVTIYVDGTISIGGNGVTTANNIPSNFKLFVTNGSSVSISGNSNFYGAVYAPNSDVQYSGNGDFYGAVIAKTYQQSGNYSLHFDVALKDVSAPCYDANVISWEEQNRSAG